MTEDSQPNPIEIKPLPSCAMLNKHLKPEPLKETTKDGTNLMKKAEIMKNEKIKKKSNALDMKL